MLSFREHVYRWKALKILIEKCWDKTCVKTFTQEKKRSLDYEDSEFAGDVILTPYMMMLYCLLT